MQKLECGKCVTREYLLNHTAENDVFCPSNGETNEQRVRFTEAEDKIVMSQECQLGLADAQILMPSESREMLTFDTK